MSAATGYAIGRHLRQLRDQQHLSLSEVSRRMGTTPGRIWAIECSGRDPLISTVIQYCDAIGARIHIGLNEKFDNDQKNGS